VLPLHLQGSHHQFFDDLAALSMHLLDLLFGQLLQQLFTNPTILLINIDNLAQSSIFKLQQLVLLIKLCFNLLICHFFEDGSLPPIFLNSHSSPLETDRQDILKLIFMKHFEVFILARVALHGVSYFCRQFVGSC